MMMRLLWTTLWSLFLLTTTTPVAAMTKADIIVVISEKTGIEKADAKRALDMFWDMTTARRGGDRISLVGFGSFSISTRGGARRKLLKKPKEIVVVDAKVSSSTTVRLGSGYVDDDCNLQVSMDIPRALTDTWPIEVGMKVPASIKKRDISASCVNTDETLQVPLLHNVMNIQLYLADLPQIGDEVLTVSIELPVSLLFPAVPSMDGRDADQTYQDNLDNVSLFLPAVTSSSEKCIGAATAGQLDLRGQTLSPDATSEDEFLKKYAGALKMKPEQAKRVLAIIQDHLSPKGFGTFSISKRAARTGRNPQTGATIKIAAKNVVRFKAGSELSGKVN